MTKILDVNDGFSSASNPSSVGISADNVNYTQGDTGDWTVADESSITDTLDEVGSRLVELEQDFQVSTKTASATLTTSEGLVLADAATGAASITLTLPAVSGNSGLKYIIKRIDNDYDYNVTIDGNGSETIDGSTTFGLYTQYDWVELFCDGTEWHITARNDNPIVLVAKTDSGQIFTDATEEDVIYEDVLKDTHSAFNTATGEYTVPSDGDWAVNASAITANLAWTAGDFIVFRIYVNGTEEAADFYEVETNLTTFLRVHVSTVLPDLTKGDVIKANLDIDRGSNSGLSAQSIYNYLCITKVK